MSEAIDGRLRSVLSNILGVPESEISEGTSPLTLAEWDSITHIQLVLAAEAEFGVQFDSDEIADLNSFALLRNAVERLSGG